MDYHLVRKIIEIHDEIIREYGGTDGLRDGGALELLAYKMNRAKNVFRKAALVLHAIASGHPFFDGNKRTAIMTAENMLGIEGLLLGCRTRRGHQSDVKNSKI